MYQKSNDFEEALSKWLCFGFCGNCGETLSAEMARPCSSWGLSERRSPALAWAPRGAPRQTEICSPCNCWFCIEREHKSPTERRVEMAPQRAKHSVPASSPFPWRPFWLRWISNHIYIPLIPASNCRTRINWRCSKQLSIAGTWGERNWGKRRSINESGFKSTNLKTEKAGNWYLYILLRLLLESLGGKKKKQ